MLTECVNWKLRPTTGAPSNPVRLTVILVGQSSGVEPRTLDELQNRAGHPMHHTLDPLLADDRSARAILDQSLYLFGEYIGAMTDGGLRLEVKILHLPEIDVPAQAFSSSLDVAGVKRSVRYAHLPGEGVQEIWRSVDDSTMSATDWWFVLYPSHVPEQYPDFAHAEFVSGGMAVGPDGQSPAFVIDDRWLVRVPLHLGSGPLDEAQRRAFLPQWFQHEFFRHLYRTYPQLKLETSGHQWFDRRMWPADFEGLMEPDYYAESLQKRLKSANPPLRIALRYAPPSQEVLGKLTPELLQGKYARTPIENGWHQGVIEWDGTSGKDAANTLRWINTAGRQMETDAGFEPRSAGYWCG